MLFRSVRDSAVRASAERSGAERSGEERSGAERRGAEEERRGVEGKDKKRENVKFRSRSKMKSSLSLKFLFGTFLKGFDFFFFGDVFISIDRVKENRELYKTIFAKELKRVMIHGALHLIGFNDSSKEEKLIMVEKENIYIDLT